MKIRWLLSAVAFFSLLSYLGVWGYFMLTRGAEPGELPVPDPPFVSSAPIEPASEAAGGEQAEVSGVVPESSVSTAADLVEKQGIELSASEVDPGGFLVLTVYDEQDPQAVTVDHPFGVTVRFYPVGDHLAALLPVKYTYEPGQYLITASGENFLESFTVTVKDRDFPTQELVVEQSTVDSTINSSSANEEYYARVQPTKFQSGDQALWEGAFLLPVEGRVTTEFGMQRITNGVPGERHGGIDLAAPLGTPVFAANTGRVVFADLIALTGNTVCIDHGLGLKSWYYHMDTLSVEEGQMVQRGEPIGTVGSTGFSTGPHLHFAVSVWNIYVDPQLVFDEAPAI